MSNLRIWLFIFGNLALINAVWSIHCWDCNSFINAGCGDPFKKNDSNFAVKDCNHEGNNERKRNFGEAKYCRKIIQKVDKQVRVIRDCGWLSDDVQEPGQCVKRTGTFSVLLEYCTCNTDGCNLICIECQSCNSFTNPNCDDPFESFPSSVVNCSTIDSKRVQENGEPDICRKIVQKVYDQKRIIRSCGWSKFDSESQTTSQSRECMKRPGTFSVMVHYCSCKGDSCNFVKNMSPSPLIVFLSWMTIFR